jgi:transposase InsO family protein
MGHLRSGAPWDTIALDYRGPFPITANGNRYILVITDRFSKYVEVMAVPKQLAEDCAFRVANEVISRWGEGPLTIHTDQGSTSESELIKELCSLFQI